MDALQMTVYTYTYSNKLRNIFQTLRPEFSSGDFGLSFRRSARPKSPAENSAFSRVTVLGPREVEETGRGQNLNEIFKKYFQI